LWKFDGNPKASRFELRGFELSGSESKCDFVQVAPAICDGRLYIGTGQDPEHFTGAAHLWCIDLERALRFGATNPNHDVSPVNDNFDARSPENKKSALAWHFGGPAPKPKKGDRDFLFCRTLSTCAVHDGLCYAAELEGFLHCLDAKTGEHYWSHYLGGGEIWGSPLWADGKVYLATDDGDVLVFQSGRTKKLLTKIEMNDMIRSSIVAANGVLYVMSEARLYAIKE
jgi:outer membrane protein assembly factor BamB